MSLTCSSEISFGSLSKDIIARFPEQFKYVSLFYAIIRLEKLESCRAEARRGATKHRRIYPTNKKASLENKKGTALQSLPANAHKIAVILKLITLVPLILTLQSNH